MSKLLKRYAAGERNFNRVELIHAELTSTELNGINLSCADLDWTNPSGGKLVDANQSEADLAEQSGPMVGTVNQPVRLSKLNTCRLCNTLDG